MRPNNDYHCFTSFRSRIFGEAFLDRDQEKRQGLGFRIYVQGFRVCRV